MKSKFLVLALAAAIVAVAGCSSKASSQADTKTAMQKRYNSEAECRKEFTNPGDCTRHTTSGGGGFFMSPFFYPWGGIMHSNGSMSYNNRVPSHGYTAAPAYAQKSMAARTNFSKVPASYTSSHSSTVRGGFGGSARGGYSSGG
jgi:hypothetical protein